MKRLLLIALMILVSLVGMVGFSRDAESQNEPLTMSEINNAVSSLEARANATDGAVSTLQATVNDGVSARAKMYYLTVTGFTGGEAITACDSGFHMAGISEIQNPSNLQYATRSTTRSTTVYDSLVDPPPFDQASDQFPDHTGWVRTEADPLTGLVHNCDVWRSSSDQQSGTTYAAWWQSTRTASCSQPEPVWCVEDPA